MKVPDIVEDVSECATRNETTDYRIVGNRATLAGSHDMVLRLHCFIC